MTTTKIPYNLVVQKTGANWFVCSASGGCYFSSVSKRKTLNFINRWFKRVNIAPIQITDFE